MDEKCIFCEQPINDSTGHVKVGNAIQCFNCFAGSHGGIFEQNGNTMKFSGMTVNEAVTLSTSKPKEEE
jgi:hypothetical protein